VSHERFRLNVDLAAMNLPHPKQELADMLRYIARDIEKGRGGDAATTCRGDKVGEWALEDISCPRCRRDGGSRATNVLIYADGRLYRCDQHALEGSVPL